MLIQSYYSLSNKALQLLPVLEQFHLEMNAHTIEQMLLNDGEELKETGKYIQSVEKIKIGFGFLEENKRDLFLLLDKFL